MTFQKCCPRCGSADIQRSHRKGWETSINFVLPYKCRVCWTRFRVFVGWNRADHISS